jgi:hypothetical protein
MTGTKRPDQAENPKRDALPRRPAKGAHGKRSPLLWLGGGLAAICLAGALLVAAASLLRPTPAAMLPTLAPTAAAVVQVPITTTATAEPTATPLPTATPEPLQVSLLAPLAGIVVDAGAPLELVISATDAVGLRSIDITANGQIVGSHNGNGQTALTINQQWSPMQAGSQRLVVTAVSRTGESISSEAVTIRVVDRAMLARNAHIFAHVEANVTEIRGLAPLTAVEPILMSRTGLRQRLQEGTYYSREDALHDLLILYSFDFVPRTFDLYALAHRYFGDSIAGFYDPATKEMVIISSSRDVNALEQWVYAHEFMHALQDQHFGLAFVSDTSIGNEQQLARRALAEGEAELLQRLYVDGGYFSRDDLIEIFNISQRMRQRDVAYMPPVLVNSFLFPYTSGLEFVETLYQRGGWTAVTTAWQNPPQSTEQILHPQRYLAGDTPQLVTLPPLTDTLGVGWDLITEEVFGEFYLREFLSQRLSEAEVDAAATGWGGDRYAVYWQAEQDHVVMLLRHTWDTLQDSHQFASAFINYATRSYGSQQTAPDDAATCWQTVEMICLYQDGSQTLIVRAPADLVVAIAGEVR